MKILKVIVLIDTVFDYGDDYQRDQSFDTWGSGLFIDM
jgi:hypothetical protein